MYCWFSRPLQVVLDIDQIKRMSTDVIWLMEFLLRRRGSKRWVRTLLLDCMLDAQSLPTVAKLLKLVNQFYFFIVSHLAYSIKHTARVRVVKHTCVRVGSLLFLHVASPPYPPLNPLRACPTCVGIPY